MQWTKPDFKEVCLNMEATAYVITEDEQSVVENHVGNAGVSSNLPKTN